MLINCYFSFCFLLLLLLLSLLLVLLAVVAVVAVVGTWLPDEPAASVERRNLAAR